MSSCRHWCCGERSPLSGDKRRGPWGSCAIRARIHVGRGAHWSLSPTDSGRVLTGGCIVPDGTIWAAMSDTGELRALLECLQASRASRAANITSGLVAQLHRSLALPDRVEGCAKQNGITHPSSKAGYCKRHHPMSNFPMPFAEPRTRGRARTGHGRRALHGLGRACPS